MLKEDHFLSGLFRVLIHSAEAGHSQWCPDCFVSVIFLESYNLNFTEWGMSSFFFHPCSREHTFAKEKKKNQSGK